MLRGLVTKNLLALIATIIFVVAALGEWPSSLRDDVRAGIPGGELRSELVGSPAADAAIAQSL